MASDNRLHHIDGLRGLAAVGVAIYHFATLYDFGLETGRKEDSVYGWETWFVRSPFDLFQGSLMVHIFFVLSGFVLLKCFHENVSFIGMFIRRYVRLVIPILISCLLCWSLDDLKLNYFPNGALNSPSPDMGIGEVLNQSLWLVLFTSPQPTWLNQVQWTMPIEFSGSVLLMIVSLLFKNRKIDPYLALLVFSILSWGYYQFFMLAGAWLYLLGKGDLFPRPPLAWKLIGLFFIVIFGSYPTVATPHHLYQFFTFKELRLVDWSSFNPLLLVPESKAGTFHGIAAILILVYVLMFKTLQDGFGKLRFLGKISFSLYLVHYPILFATCGFYVMGIKNNIPEIGFACAAITFFGISFGLAWLMYHFVEKPTIQLSRGLGSKMDNLTQGNPFSTTYVNRQKERSELRQN